MIKFCGALFHALSRGPSLPMLGLVIGLASLVAVHSPAIGSEKSHGSEEKQGEKDTKKMSLRERFALPSHIQLRPLLVPIHHRYLKASAITIFMEADVKKQVGAICHKVPRIIDAILRVLSRDPIPTRRGKLVLDDVAAKILGPINETLDETHVRSIHIEAGMVRVGSNGISRLPFATINGCRGIKEIELEVIKEERKAKEHK